MRVGDVPVFAADLLFVRIVNFGESPGFSRAEKSSMVKKWRQSYEKHLN